MVVLVLAAATAASATTGLGVGGSWFDEQRIVAIVVLISAASIGVRSTAGPRGVGEFLVAASLVFGLASVAFAARPYVAALDWSIYCLMALLIVSSSTMQPSRIETTAALAVVILAGAYVTGVLANYASALFLGFPVGAETLLVGFANPRFPAHLQALTIPLLPLAARRAPGAHWRMGVAVVAGLWWMCFIGSGSRTGWIAIVTVALVVSILNAEGRRWLRLQLIFAASGAALWVAMFHLVPASFSVPSAPETGRLSEFGSLGARFELWRLSIEASLRHPLFGLGPMHFAYVDNGLAAHPHNFWLQVAAEWGIPAALLFLSATLVLVVGLWRRLQSEPDCSIRSSGVAIFGAVIAWGVGTLSDGYMIVPTSQMVSTAVFMLAVMWLRLAAPAPAFSQRAQHVTSSVRTALLAVAIGVLVSLAFTDFGKPTRREQAWRAEHTGQIMWPRFWQQGWIGPEHDPAARTYQRSQVPPK